MAAAVCGSSSRMKEPDDRSAIAPLTGLSEKWQKFDGVIKSTGFGRRMPASSWWPRRRGAWISTWFHSFPRTLGNIVATACVLIWSRCWPTCIRAFMRFRAGASSEGMGSAEPLPVEGHHRRRSPIGPENWNRWQDAMGRRDCTAVLPDLRARFFLSSFSSARTWARAGANSQLRHGVPVRKQAAGAARPAWSFVPGCAAT